MIYNNNLSHIKFLYLSKRFTFSRKYLVKYINYCNTSLRNILAKVNISDSGRTLVISYPFEDTLKKILAENGEDNSLY